MLGVFLNISYSALMTSNSSVISFGELRSRQLTTSSSCPLTKILTPQLKCKCEVILNVRKREAQNTSINHTRLYYSNERIYGYLIWPFRVSFFFFFFWTQRQLPMPCLQETIAKAVEDAISAASKTIFSLRKAVEMTFETRNRKPELP